MTQARLKPLDNAEQDYVLRQRLSHPLSHRPLLSIKSRLASLAAATALQAGQDGASSSTSMAASPLPLMAELQSYLVSLTRTSLSSTTTAASQIEEYERQYAEIRAEEEASTARIAALKKQLEEVRRRRREKIEYGRVAESIERWFKTGSVDASAAASSQVEIEETLSTLVSHLTSSFLYKSQPQETEATAASSASADDADHSQTLTLLHSKLDEMLNLSRQVREIVGWKSGPASGMKRGGGGGDDNNSSSNVQRQADSTRSSTPHIGGGGGSLNPNAKPFQPVPSAGEKRSRGGQVDEGDAAKKQRMSSGSGGGGGDDDDEEEGSIPTATAATKATTSTSSSRRGTTRPTTAAAAAAPPLARAPSRARGRGRGRGGWD